MQSNAEETPRPNSTEIVEREEIEGTPFQMIGNEEHGYFAAMGRFRVTEKMHDKSEVIKWMRENMWIIVMNVATILAETISEQKISEHNAKN